MNQILLVVSADYEFQLSLGGCYEVVGSAIVQGRGTSSSSVTPVLDCLHLQPMRSLSEQLIKVHGDNVLLSSDLYNLYRARWFQYTFSWEGRKFGKKVKFANCSSVTVFNPLGVLSGLWRTILVPRFFPGNPISP